MAELTENFNFFQPTNFKIVIDRKQYGNLEFFAQRVTHPGISIPSPNVSYKRVSSISIPGDTLSFDELSFDVIVDENLESYIEVYNWVTSLTDTKFEKVLNNKKQLSQPSEVDITIAVLSSANNKTKYFRYIDCTPTGVGSLSLESVSSDNNVVTFSVSFKVNYFDIT